MSIRKLSESADTSTASVLRFVRRLGFSGFSDFKTELIRCLAIGVKDKKNNSGSVEDKINWSDSFDSIKNKFVLTITDIVKGVMLINENEEYYKITDAIKNADTIYFIALGSSLLAARDMQHKLMRLRKRCIFLEDSNYGLQNIVIATKRDVIIAFSFDGKSKKVINAVLQAKERDVTVISITKYSQNRLENLAVYSLYVPNIAIDDSSLSSVFRRYGQLVVADLIYINLAKNNFRS